MVMAVLVNGSDIHGSKRQHGLLTKIIKQCLFLIMISPQRMNNAESLYDHSAITCL